MRVRERKECGGKAETEWERAACGGTFDVQEGDGEDGRQHDADDNHGHLARRHAALHAPVADAHLHHLISSTSPGACERHNHITLLKEPCLSGMLRSVYQ